MILDDIIGRKMQQLKEEMAKISIEGWKQRLKQGNACRSQDFYSVLKGGGRISIIAEVKKASPSRGVFCENFDPVKIAREYCSSDVQAISVLTERNFFMGCEDDLVKVRQICPLPLLRKDFIVNLWQVYQSRYLGADAILLIASILTDEQLRKFRIVAGILGMQCLVEVHDRKDLERALESGAKIIGINNRNLETFEEELRTTERLINHIPHDRAVVSESGIRTPQDFLYLMNLGVDAVLVGEAFMRSDSVRDTIREWRTG